MKTTLSLKLALPGLLLSGYNKSSSRNIMSRILLSLLLLLSLSQAEETRASWDDGKSKNWIHKKTFYETLYIFILLITFYINNKFFYTSNHKIILYRLYYLLDQAIYLIYFE